MPLDFLSGNLTTARTHTVIVQCACVLCPER